MKTKKLYLLMAGWMDGNGSLWPTNKDLPTWKWMDEQKAKSTFDGLKVSDFEQDEAKTANYLISGLRAYASLNSFEFPENIVKQSEQVAPEHKNEFLTEMSDYDFKEEREKYLEFSKEIKIFAWTFEHRAKLQRLYEDFLRDTKETKTNFTDFILFMYAKEREKLNVEAN